MTRPSTFKLFKTSPEIIRLAVMMYVRCPLSLRNVENLLHERGVEISHETVRFRWHRFGPTFAAEIRKRRIESMRSSQWRWHLDEMFVKINGERHYLWRAVDHEVEVLASFVTKSRDKEISLKFLREAMRRHGRPLFKSSRAAALAEWRGLCAGKGIESLSCPRLVRICLTAMSPLFRSLTKGRSLSFHRGLA